MSALDKIRSFAEARELDEAPIRDGITDHPGWKNAYEPDGLIPVSHWCDVGLPT